MMSTETKTYRVPSYNLDTLRARVAKIGVRAVRLGVAAPALVVGEPEHVEIVKDGQKTGRFRTFYPVTLEHPVVRLDGWQFVAALTPAYDDAGEHVGNIIRKAPDAEGIALPTFQGATVKCDHCQTARRRNETYVVRFEATGETKQVGSKCLVDFLGHDAKHAATMAECLFDLASAADDAEREDDGFLGQGRGSDVLGTEEFLAYVVTCARIDGWKSRAEARDSFGTCSTCDAALSLMFKRPEYRKADDPKPTEADRALAAEIVEWGKALRERADVAESDYLSNLSMAFAGSAFPGKAAGIVASAYVAFSREKEREIKRRAMAAQSKHVGTVGARVTMTLRVTGLRAFESAYGVTTLVSFLDAEGNVVKWWASREPNLAVDSVYTGKVTVKEHGEYQGVAETTVTRCALAAVPA